MFYEKISREEIESMENEHGFTPNYSYENYVTEINEDDEIVEEYYENLTIHKTADEAYEEYLENKDKPIEPEVDEVAILSSRVDELEVELQEQLINSCLAQAELFELTLVQDEQILDSYMAQAELFELILSMQQEIDSLKSIDK